MGQMVRSAYRDLREGLGGLTAQQRSRDGILFLSNKDTEVDSSFTQLHLCPFSYTILHPLDRVPGRHFVKKNDPKEEALAILKSKGPPPKVRETR